MKKDFSIQQALYPLTHNGREYTAILIHLKDMRAEQNRNPSSKLLMGGISLQDVYLGET